MSVRAVLALAVRPRPEAQDKVWIGSCDHGTEVFTGGADGTAGSLDE